MKKIIVICLVLAAFNVAGQDVPIIKIGDLQKIINTKNTEVLIINFWATWCAPCVAELPVFEKVHTQRLPQTAVYLINLDYADKVNRVRSFINRKNISAPVFLLDETDYNSWIDKIEPSWSGAIPATIIINTKTGKRKFIGKEISEAELQSIISEIKTL